MFVNPTITVWDTRVTPAPIVELMVVAVLVVHHRHIENVAQTAPRITLCNSKFDCGRQEHCCSNKCSVGNCIGKLRDTNAECGGDANLQCCFNLCYSWKDCDDDTSVAQCNDHSNCGGHTFLFHSPLVSETSASPWHSFNAARTATTVP